jgi:hypothetical protein
VKKKFRIQAFYFYHKRKYFMKKFYLVIKSMLGKYRKWFHRIRSRIFHLFRLHYLQKKFKRLKTINFVRSFVIRRKLLKIYQKNIMKKVCYACKEKYEQLEQRKEFLRLEEMEIRSTKLTALTEMVRNFQFDEEIKKKQLEDQQKETARLEQERTVSLLLQKQYEECNEHKIEKIEMTFEDYLKSVNLNPENGEDLLSPLANDFNKPENTMEERERLDESYNVDDFIDHNISGFPNRHSKSQSKQTAPIPPSLPGPKFARPSSATATRTAKQSSSSSSAIDHQENILYEQLAANISLTSNIQARKGSFHRPPVVAETYPQQQQYQETYFESSTKPVFPQSFPAEPKNAFPSSSFTHRQRESFQFPDDHLFDQQIPQFSQNSPPPHHQYFQPQRGGHETNPLRLSADDEKIPLLRNNNMSYKSSKSEKSRPRSADPVHRRPVQDFSHNAQQTGMNDRPSSAYQYQQQQYPPVQDHTSAYPYDYYSSQSNDNRGQLPVSYPPPHFPSRQAQQQNYYPQQQQQQQQFHQHHHQPHQFSSSSSSVAPPPNPLMVGGYDEVMMNLFQNESPLIPGNTAFLHPSYEFAQQLYYQNRSQPQDHHPKKKKSHKKSSLSHLELYGNIYQPPPPLPDKEPKKKTRTLRPSSGSSSSNLHRKQPDKKKGIYSTYLS